MAKLPDTPPKKSGAASPRKKWWKPWMGPASQWAVILTTAVTSTENCGVHLRVPLRDGWSSGELEGLSFSTSHNCREAQHSIRCNQATVTMGLRVLLVDSDLNRFHVSLTSAIFDVAPFTAPTMRSLEGDHPLVGQCSATTSFR